MLEIFIVIGLYRLLKGSLERKGRGTGLAGKRRTVGTSGRRKPTVDIGAYERQ